MRIKRAEAAEREQFMRCLFEADPSLSVPKANDRLHAKFGSKMNAARAYAIRAAARAGVALSAPQALPGAQS